MLYKVFSVSPSGQTHSPTLTLSFPLSLSVSFPLAHAVMNSHTWG